MPLPKSKPEADRYKSKFSNRKLYSERVYDTAKSAIEKGYLTEPTLIKKVLNKEINSELIEKLSIISGSTISSEDQDFKQLTFVDYRSASPQHAHLSIKSTKKVDQLVHLNRYVGALCAKLPTSFTAQFCAFSEQYSIEENPEQISRSIKANLNIRHMCWADFDNEYKYYRYLRTKIEGCGISVVHQSVEDKSIRGAYFLDKKFSSHLIFINTRQQNTKSRIFTLLHEFGHYLIGASGLSNSYKARNEIETFCNRFATSFLMPRDDFSVDAESVTSRKQVSKNQSIALLSRTYCISKHATAIRLKQLNFWTEVDLREWLSQFDGAAFPEEELPSGGPQTDIGLIKLAHLGTFAASVTLEAHRLNLTHESEIFLRLRLKPKYLSKLKDALELRIQEHDEISL